MTPLRRRGAAAILTGVLPATAAVVAAAWLAGFIWFVQVARQAGIAQGQADGIVVLTGGAERIATGMHLLAAGRGRVLLISGVGHGADLPGLLHGTGIDPAPLAARVTLGRDATSTTGNADETAAWAREHRLHALIVVTASYHMWRALTELQRSLPGVRLLPVAVLPPALRGGSRLSTLRLLASEYTKFLASALDLARLSSRATEAPPQGGQAGRQLPAGEPG